MAKFSQSYKKKTSEVINKPLKGLTSTPPVLSESDSMVDCLNFIFKNDGVLASRPGVSTATYHTFNSTTINSAIEYFNGLNNTIVFDSDSKLVCYDPSDNNGIPAGITVGGTDIVFDNTSYKDACVFKDSVYYTTGTSYLLKYSGGTTATNIYVPNCEMYGEPTSICQAQGRLFTITDKNYLRYTAIDSDTVWEDRVLMGGTLTATTTSTAISGSETAFNQVTVTGETLFPGAGVRILITSGTTEEYLTIASVSSNTEMIVTTIPTLSGTELTWYLIGTDYYEPIDPGSNLDCKMIVPFSNALAISMVGKSVTSNYGSIIYLKPTPQNNTSVLLIQQKRMSGNLEVFPYSLAEIDDNLLFFSSRGLYAVPASTVYSDSAIKPTPISEGKLETKLLDFDITKKNLTRIRVIRNKRYNLILINFVNNKLNDTDSNYLISGYMNSEGVEFTELSYSLDGGGGGARRSFKNFLVFDSELYFIGDFLISKTFRVGIPVAYDTVDPTGITMDTTRITGDNDYLTIDMDYTDPSTYSIKRTLKTGLTSINLTDWVRIQKLYVYTSENIDATRAGGYYNISPYTVGALNSNQASRTSEKSLLTIRKEYQYTTTPDNITWDSTLVTFDNTNLTFDMSSVDIVALIKQYSYMVNARSLVMVGLKIDDETSSGYLEVHGYGFSLLSSK